MPDLRALPESELQLLLLHVTHYSVEFSRDQTGRHRWLLEVDRKRVFGGRTPQDLVRRACVWYAATS